MVSINKTKNTAFRGGPDGYDTLKQKRPTAYCSAIPQYMNLCIDQIGLHCTIVTPNWSILYIHRAASGLRVDLPCNSNHLHRFELYFLDQEQTDGIYRKKGFGTLHGLNRSYSRWQIIDHFDNNSAYAVSPFGIRCTDLIYDHVHHFEANIFQRHQTSRNMNPS